MVMPCHQTEPAPAVTIIGRLILDVMDDNPGALTVIKVLLDHPQCYALLQHLRSRGLIGSHLWSLVKDAYGGDVLRFVQAQLAIMPGHGGACQGDTRE